MLKNCSLIKDNMVAVHVLYVHGIVKFASLYYGKVGHSGTRGYSVTVMILHIAGNFACDASWHERHLVESIFHVSHAELPGACEIMTVPVCPTFPYSCMV